MKESSSKKYKYKCCLDFLIGNIFIDTKKENYFPKKKKEEKKKDKKKFPDIYKNFIINM